MKKLFTQFLLAFGFCLMMTAGAIAQRTISGTITDAETNDPLIGANDLLQGASGGTITDIDGK